MLGCLSRLSCSPVRSRRLALWRPYLNRRAHTQTYKSLILGRPWPMGRANGQSVVICPQMGSSVSCSGLYPVILFPPLSSSWSTGVVKACWYICRKCLMYLVLEYVSSSRTTAARTLCPTMEWRSWTYCDNDYIVVSGWPALPLDKCC